MRINKLCLSLVVLACIGSGAKAEIGPEDRPWPAARPCEPCIPLQFGTLEMGLPLAATGKILVMGSDLSALVILPRSNSSVESVLFLSVPPDRLIGMYRQADLLRSDEELSNTQFFDTLGLQAAADSPYVKLRQIHHADAAKAYIKMSNGALHAYWIQAVQASEQQVYFVVDGQDTVYLLGGNVTQELLDAMLSRMRVAAIP